MDGIPQHSITILLETFCRDGYIINDYIHSNTNVHYDIISMVNEFIYCKVPHPCFIIKHHYPFVPLSVDLYTKAMLHLHESGLPTAGSQLDACAVAKLFSYIVMYRTAHKLYKSEYVDLYSRYVLEANGFYPPNNNIFNANESVDYILSLEKNYYNDLCKIINI